MRNLPRKQIPAAWAVFAIALALVLVLVSAIGLLAWNSYSDALERARVRASSSAHVVSAHMQWLMAAGLQTLEEADRLAGPDPGRLPGSFVIHYSEPLRHLPRGIDLSLFGPAGKILFSTSSRKDPVPPEGVADFLASGNDKEWSVSPMLIDPASGEKSFLIKRRLLRSGATAGAAVLTVPAGLMSDFWTPLDLGPGSTIGLMRDDGWLVARHPPAAKPTNLKDYVLFTDYLKKAPSGVYDALSPVDGNDRVVGYRRVPDAPLVVVASVSRNFALAELKEQMWRLGYFLVPLLIGLGALAYWVARLLKRDELMRVSLAAAVEKNNLLMREIHHRTKNNLQSVASLVKLQPISEEAKAAMTARIAAMSAVHEQAYRSDQYSDVELREYLTLLIGNIRNSGSGDVVIETQLAPAMIDRDYAQPLGLVVNEVVSNAMKHAFKGRGRGRIGVTLAMIAPDKAELVIEDDGVGHAPQDEGRGMGSRLIRAFAQQLGNDYDFSVNAGTRFAIRFAAKPVPLH